MFENFFSITKAPEFPQDFNWIITDEPSDVEYFENKLYITDTNNHPIWAFDLKTNSLDPLDVR